MKKRGEGGVEGARGEVRLGLTIGHDRIMAVRLSTRGGTALALEAPLFGVWGSGSGNVFSARRCVWL